MEVWEKGQEYGDFLRDILKKAAALLVKLPKGFSACGGTRNLPIWIAGSSLMGASFTNDSDPPRLLFKIKPHLRHVALLEHWKPKRTFLRKFYNFCGLSWAKLSTIAYLRSYLPTSPKITSAGLKIWNHRHTVWFSLRRENKTEYFQFLTLGVKLSDNLRWNAIVKIGP